MVKLTLDYVENSFNAGGGSPWTEERKLQEALFKIPPIWLTAAIFGTYSQMELPYWNLKADAMRHAVYCVKRGVYDTNDVVADYESRVLVPSRDTILGNGEYASIINDILDGLPPSKSKVQYSQVVRERFGFDGKPKSPETLAKELGVTRAFIINKEGEALRIMRHPSRLDRIKVYLEDKRWKFLKYLYEIGLVGHR